MNIALEISQHVYNMNVCQLHAGECSLKLPTRGLSWRGGGQLTNLA